jgi:hypothetical protein
MHLLRYSALLLCVFYFTLPSFSQPSVNYRQSLFSKEDQRDALLDQSRKLKTQAIIASVTGPLMAGVGFYMLSRESSVSLSGSGGYMSVRENTSANRMFGTILAGVGCATTITILPLIIRSAKAKKQANLILSNQSTGFLKLRKPVPSLGLRIAL